MEISNTNQLIINTNRLAIEQQLRDIEDQIAYLRRAFGVEEDFKIDEPETCMRHQATNMMSRVMELGALISANATIIKMENAKVGA
jgi:hypothetical protein